MKKILSLLIVLCLSCEDERYNIDDYPNQLISDPSGACISGEIAGAVASGNNNVLVWADEFDVDGSPCEENWFHETIPPNNGSWWNGETQYYTNKLSNSFVEDGLLHIVAKKESYKGKNFTSARLVTNKLFDFTYGKVEVRAKLTNGMSGTWPAIWLLGSDFETNPWPACGEIDIMEQFGKDAPEIKSTIHHSTSPEGVGYTKATTVADGASNFHVYAVNWTPNKIEFSIDGNVYHSQSNDASLPFNSNFFIILNVAIEGYSGTIDPAFTNTEMIVDYVRIYQ